MNEFVIGEIYADLKRISLKDISKHDMIVIHFMYHGIEYILYDRQFEIIIVERGRKIVYTNRKRNSYSMISEEMILLIDQYLGYKL